MNHCESFGKNERTLYEPPWHSESLEIARERECVGRNRKGARVWVWGTCL